MKKTRLFMLVGVALLSFALVGMALAADSYQDKNPPNKATDSSAPNTAAPLALWPGPDGFGYTGQVISQNWVDITASGTPITGLGDDNSAGPFPLGFTFNFYGTPWTDFYANSNGFLTFGAGSSSLSNQCPLPNSSAPDNVVAMLWDDLNFTTSGTAYYQTYGTCPVGTGVCTVVEYYNVAYYGGVAGSAGTWETIFYEDGSLMIQFLNAGVELGSGSTTGMEDANYPVDYGLTYACDTPTSLYDGLSVLFSVAPAPRLNESTKKAPSKIEAGNPINYTITILNTGDAPAANASLVDPIPLGTIYNGDVACSSGTCSFDGTQVIWSGVVPAPTESLEWKAPSASTKQPFTINQPSNVSLDSSIVYNPVKQTSEILLDQEPNQANGIFSDANCDFCGGSQVLAENFALEDTTMLEQVVMWGAFYSLDVPGEPDVIRVIIHQDAAGLPGTVVYDENNIGYSRTQTGVILFGVHEWQHTLTLASPAVLPAGNYWIEIYFTTGVGDNNDYFWETGNPDTMGRGLLDSAYAFEAPGISWNYPNGAEMAFQLIGTIGEVSTNPVTVTFSVTPDGLSCGDTVVNNAVIDDPGLIAPVNVSASTELVNTIYYAEDFEANNGGYTSVGTNPWTWGPPPPALAPSHSGVNAWATESPYVVSADYQLVSPWIDLTNAIPNRDLVLQWWQMLDVEVNYDYAYVDISMDGTNWTNVWVGNYHGVWENISVDITPYIGQLIELRFELVTDSSVVYNGWAIDDVTIHSGCQLFVDPNIVVTPLSLLGEQQPSMVTTQTLQICNVGFSPLNWSLTEVTTGKNLSNQPKVALPTKANVTNTQSDNVTPFEGAITQVGTGLQGSAGSSGLGNPEAVLYDNGPLVTIPAACSGMDASRLQTDLGMNTLGFGHQYSLGYRMADDFTITDPSGWQIDQITLFAYQTGAASSPSPIVGVYYQIWDGPPDNPGSSVVFGDLTTNRLLSTTNPNMQRDSVSSSCANNRYIFADVVSAGFTLPPGTYWIDWSTDGNPSYSGPWAPPVTIIGQTTTGNAIQYTTAWAAALDTGTATQQGLPFIIEGSVISNPPDILLLNADDDNTSGSPIQTMLQAYGDLGSVDLYDARYATPTLAELQAYDVVVVWSNYYFADATAIGNVLADYVDAGGKVIDMMFALDPGWGYQGRFRTEGYSAMTTTSYAFGTVCLGAYDPSHPIMAGVTDVCEYYMGTGTALTAGSSEVARWANNELFVAVKDDQTVATLNGYVGYHYQWTGQENLVLHNAILWLVSSIPPSDIPWLSENPLSGTLDPSACTFVDVRFDSAGLVPNTYTGILDVNSNDPDTPIVPVGVTLNVFLAPVISVDPTSLTSTLLPDTQETQNLNVCNTGQADLVWDLTEVPGLKVNSMTPVTDVAANPPRQVALTVGNLPGSGKITNTPSIPVGAVPLVLDDGSAENNIGVGNGTTGIQFIWLNRFTPAPADFPFNLNQIQVFFSSGTGVNVSDVIDLVVYQDADSDPSNGATWLATYNVIVQAVDGTTWSVYDLPSPLLISGPGDVLIAVINRYTISGVSPETYPAALDGTASQSRSWAGWWSADPPNPAILPPDATFGLIDGFGLPGNWLVRGYGTTVSADIPWLSETPISGTVPAGDCTTIDITFNSTGLAPSTYTGALDITSNDPDTPVVNVPVTLNVVVPNIVVTPDTLDLTLFPDETGTLTFTIQNTGGWNLDWSVTDGATWLSELPILGSTIPGGSTEVVATFDSTGLTPGIYETNIDIASNDPDTPDVVLPATLTVNALNSDLSVIKSASADEVRVGEMFTYTLVVNNAGPQDAVGVMLVDTLPTLVTFVSASPQCAEVAGVVTCDIGDLAADEDITLTIVVTATDVGTATNTAVVSSEFVNDPVPGNNTATVDTEIRPLFYYFYLSIVQKH